MEISKAVQTVAGKYAVSMEIEGVGTVEFPKLSTREVAAFGEQIRVRRREAIKASSKDAGLKPAETYRALQEAEYEASLEEIADYLSTPKMSVAIIEKSLEKAGKAADAPAILEKIGPIETRNLARSIAGTTSLYGREPKKEAPGKPSDTSGFGVAGENPLP